MASPISKLLFLLTLTLLASNLDIANAAIRGKTQRKIERANRYGPYIGIVVASQSALKPLLQHPSFEPETMFNSTLEVSGKRFRIGTLAGERVILVLSGLSMINSGITTQLLVSLFRIKGVVHYGIAGNADPARNIGDVVVPLFWSHLGLWTWQRFGDGPANELPLEGSGTFTRRYGRLSFEDYNVNVISGCGKTGNLLNNVWYQPEEVSPDDESTGERQQIMWVEADAKYHKVVRALEKQGVELQQCLNSAACLPTTPKLARVARGASASIYVDNAAYRTFLKDKFNVGPVDMESAAVALICYQQSVPFIVIRSIANLAGAASELPYNFNPLAVNNAVTVVVEFVKLAHTTNVTHSGQRDFYEPLDLYVDSE